ncbi:hypothetical protein ACO22_05258, partial [Paracoccidioides brasiliensis]
MHHNSYHPTQAAGHEAPSPESDMEWMHSVGWLIRRMEHHGFEQIIMAMPVVKKFKKFMTLYLKHAHKKILAQVGIDARMPDVISACSPRMTYHGDFPSGMPGQT